MTMIRDLLQEDLIVEDLAATDKEGVIREFAGLLKARGRVRDEQELVRVLTERESLGSTGIGGSVAIPHGKLSNLAETIVAFGRSSRGVDFQSMDGKPVTLFFLLVSPLEKTGEHLKTLARISRIFKNSALRDRLRSASGSEEMKNLIYEEDGKYPQPHPVPLK